MIISNSTPLINFGTLDRLDVLKALFGEIVIPCAVENELLIKGSIYPASAALRKADFITVKNVEKDNIVNMLSSSLDPGEAEVIALACRESDTKLLIMDELDGRECARKFGYPVIGTIGCLVEAKRKGIIDEVRSLLLEMRNKAGFWINESFLQHILQDVKEA